MKIAINTIAKNEAHNVKDWVQAGKDADYLVVLDTGSSDDTLKLLQDSGVITGQKEITPWRFDVARNEALKLVPDDCDVVIAVDMDERLQDGWREALEQAWTPDTDLMNYWLHDKFVDDKPTVEDNRLKIFKRHGIQWFRPIHEVPQKIDGVPNVKLCKDIIIKHNQKLGEPERDYTRLLEQWIAEDPEGEAQIEMYPELAHEYSKKGDFSKALKTLEMFLELSSKKHCSNVGCMKCLQVAGSRSSAEINIANCKHNLGWSPQVIIGHLLKAVAECPSKREPWAFLADGMYAVGNYAMAHGCAVTAMSITDPMCHTKNMNVWGDFPERIEKASLEKIILSKANLNQ